MVSGDRLSKIIDQSKCDSNIISICFVSGVTIEKEKRCLGPRGIVCNVLRLEKAPCIVKGLRYWSCERNKKVLQLATHASSGSVFPRGELTGARVRYRG